MDVALLIPTSRRNAGLSRAELAHRAESSSPTVTQYEAGRVSPSVSNLERLLHAARVRLLMSTVAAGAAGDLSGSRMRRLQAMRPEIQRAARRAHARTVRASGSVARGQDRPDIDLDRLFDAPVEQEGCLLLIGRKRELERLLGESVNVSTPALLGPEIAERALAEAVPL